MTTKNTETTDVALAVRIASVALGLASMDPEEALVGLMGAIAIVAGQTSAPSAKLGELAVMMSYARDRVAAGEIKLRRAEVPS